MAFTWFQLPPTCFSRQHSLSHPQGLKKKLTNNAWKKKKNLQDSSVIKCLRRCPTQQPTKPKWSAANVQTPQISPEFDCPFLNGSKLVWHQAAACCYTPLGGTVMQWLAVSNPRWWFLVCPVVFPNNLGSYESCWFWSGCRPGWEVKSL